MSSSSGTRSQIREHVGVNSRPTLERVCEGGHARVRRHGQGILQRLRQKERVPQDFWHGYTLLHVDGQHARNQVLCVL